MSFRPLLPATENRGPSGQPPDEPRREPIRKRSRPAVQACNYCRRVKAKCDGQRPKCSTCISKSQECGYAGGPGQSRQEAMKTRLHVLDDLFRFLQVKSPGQASRLLKRIRSTEDLTSIFEHGADAEMMELDVDDESAPSDEPSSTTDFHEHRPGSSHASSLTTADFLLSINFSLSDIESLDKGIEGFFSCSGKLFHVFNHEEVASYQAQLFAVDDSAVQKAHICYITAVAAVGTQYLHQPGSRAAERTLYDIARYYFEDVLQASPLHAVKICTLLAMYNLMEKPALAQAYVEIGISLSARYGLQQAFRNPRIDISLWTTGQKALRTLSFFSAWLGAALGNMNTVGIMPPRLNISDFRHEPSSDLEEAVQTELTKIAVITANIYRMNLEHQDLYMLSIDTMLRDLEEWYASLPDAMDAEKVARKSIPHEVRRSTYHVHLLYLGTIVLLYRRVASHLLQAKTSNPARHMLGDQLSTVRKTMEKGEHAAKRSANIANLLLSEHQVFKRCWVLIFQVYVSSTILLYEAMKKILSYSPISEWEDDLEQARKCIEALKYCGTEDPVALMLLQHVQGPYEDIQEHLRSPEYRSSVQTMAQARMEGTEDSSQSPLSEDYSSLPEKLLGIPRDHNAALAKKALKVIEMLCQPFKNVGSIDELEKGVKVNIWDDPTRYEFAHLIGRLGLDFELKQPFQWDKKQDEPASLPGSPEFRLPSLSLSLSRTS